MGSSSGQSSSDLSLKILLIGDSGVGKSSLLVSFISNSVQDLAPTIGKGTSIRVFQGKGADLDHFTLSTINSVGDFLSYLWRMFEGIKGTL